MKSSAPYLVLNPLSHQAEPTTDSDVVSKFCTRRVMATFGGISAIPHIRMRWKVTFIVTTSFKIIIWRYVQILPTFCLPRLLFFIGFFCSLLSSHLLLTVMYFVFLLLIFFLLIHLHRILLLFIFLLFHVILFSISSFFFSSLFFQQWLTSVWQEILCKLCLDPCEPRCVSSV
jgi:hypothetical protein